MAETAITAALSKLGELAAREAKVLLQLGDDMVLLRDRLEWLKAFIRDADQKRRAGSDGLTRVWVRQTRDVAFEAEDALDEFIYQVELKSQLSGGFKVRRTPSWWNMILIRHELSSGIKIIKSRLNQITENQKAYKIEHTPQVILTSSTTAASAWSNDVTNAVGFDDDVVTLKGMLGAKDHTRLMFISIFGDRGVGKFTLADVMFYEVMKDFQIPLWFNMPLDSNKEVLLQGIYDQAVIQKQQQDPRFDPKEDTRDVADKLHSLLTEKTYLLVLGGISSKTMLNWLKPRLPDDNNRSRVVLLLDTESEEVARHANTMNGDDFNRIHPLSRLDEKRSGQLFRSRALRKEPSSYKEKKENENEKEKENNIVYNVTGGYPLAIVLLAGLLRFKEKPGQWEAVLQQLSPGPDNGGNKIIGAVLSKDNPVEWKMNPATEANLSGRTAIDRIFWASFEDLPNNLKPCYLYFAAFFMNISLSADEIVRMWIAEGFIKPRNGKTMEEQGGDYLKELVLRCLVQKVWLNNSDGISEVKVHTSLHGFLHSEVREAGFVEIHDTHNAFVPPSVRRLSFHSFDGRYTIFSKDLPKLRSFICHVIAGDQSRGNTNEKKEKRNEEGNNDEKKKNEGDEKKKDGSRDEIKDLHDIKFLHVSNFRRIFGARCRSKFLRVISIKGLRLQKMPKEIGDLIHLRYLLVHSMDLKDLPSRIRRLLNLQTLDIRKTEVMEIDPGFWKIKVLRHVLAENLMLPVSIEEELDELQTLHGVRPAQGEWNEQNCPLDKMTNLRSLELHGFVHATHGAALESALTKMHLLGHLKLKGDMISSWVFTGQRLEYLQTVELDGEVTWPPIKGEFEHLRHFRPNLVHLKLTNTNDASEDIKKELVEMGFNRSEYPPAYKLSY